MDTSDPQIRFDDEGVCNHCKNAEKRFRNQLLPLNDRRKALEDLVLRIKREGKNNEYDCIIGLSGGIDSSTTAYHVKRLGLNPLAVHLDNGWDTELAVDNIKILCEKLQIDLYTHVIDWDEFRRIQLSFLRASVPNCEIPTDHAITALLFKTARRRNVRFILSGSNLVTEAIMPISWTYYNQDLKHMRSIHKLYSNNKLITMPTISLFDYLYYILIRRIRQIPFLNFVDYNKDEAKELLRKELGWRDYGGKHHESVWTRFYQGYYLPAKFGYDKRRPHLSTLICSGQMTRDQALAELTTHAYSDDLLRSDMEFVVKKFALSREEFERIIEQPNKDHGEYPGHHFLFGRLVKYKNLFRKIATSTS